MSEERYTRITITSGRSTTYYTEQEIAEYCQMEVPAIRRLQAAGLLQGVEPVGEERRYAEEDIMQLRRIRRLHRDLGINLAGIEVILRLSERLQSLQQELEQYRNRDK